jgi:predicted patatin/cPLA2 family phospholipase
LEELRSAQDKGTTVKEFNAKGDTRPLPADHPVREILLRRKSEGSKPGKRAPADKAKVALVVEGGGMRGCTTAGMCMALVELGLIDAVDEVYGASAGSLVGAYAQTLAHSPGAARVGCSVYYDELTRPIGKGFIDKGWLPRALGLGALGLLYRPVRAFLDLKNNFFGSPILNLDWLLYDCIREKRPLDWQKFEEIDRVQPLHVVASGLSSEGPVVLSSRGGDWHDLPSFAECLRASMLLPGICGPPQRLPNRSEDLVDAMLFDSLSMRSALAGGATHLVVLRSRPDGKNLVGTSKVGNKMTKRYFGRKLGKDRIVDYMVNSRNRIRYIEDILRLNHATKNPSSKERTPGAFKPVLTLSDEESGLHPVEAEFPHALAIAMPASHKEVTKVEQARATVFEGVRAGFACAYDVLMDPGGELTGGDGVKPLEETAGGRAAMETFPDSLLEMPEDPVGVDYAARQRAATI